MVIIWRGYGWLVAVTVFGFSLLANLLFDATFGGGFYDHHKWPFAVSLLLSAITCWFLGLRLKRRSDRIAVDNVTGKDFTVNQSRHTLFFIPMHYWGPILGVVALVLGVVDLLRR